MKTAPSLHVTKWLNTDQTLSLEKLRGKVVALHAFQMLCPGCVLHGLPQAQKTFEIFNPEHIAVIGLHTVFEHHQAMQEESLKAFIHEFRLQFPIGIDEASPGGPIPKTMELYEMRGTPTWVIIDRQGDIRMDAFGQVEDMVLGAEIAKLALEGVSTDINIYKGKSAR